MLSVALIICFFANADAVVNTSTPVSYEPFDYENAKEKTSGGGVEQIYAYAPSTVFYNGMFHQFYCSTGRNSDNYYDLAGKTSFKKAYDHIRYRTSRNGVDWSAPRIVMTSDARNTEACACDPSVVYDEITGYWYMLYDGMKDGIDGDYGTVVYLARAKYIHGPYFRFTTENKWEDEGSTKPARAMIYKKRWQKKYGVGQQSIVVANPGTPNRMFYVWFIDNTGLTGQWKDDNGNIHYYLKLKFTAVNDLRLLSYANSYDASIYDNSTASYTVLSKHYPILGDVRYNTSTGKFEMWSANYGEPQGETEMSVFKYESSDALYWRGTEVSVKPYYNIHNVGISGDEHGWIWNNKFLMSFGGPQMGVTKGRNVTFRDEKENICVGKWPMWNVLVEENAGISRELLESTKIKILETGFAFDSNIKHNKVEPVTGDFDGDGITDFGFVNMKNGVWYIRSSRKQKIVSYSDLKGEFQVDNSKPVVGDYDGDGVDDIGFYTFYNGGAKWHIVSGKKKILGLSNVQGIYDGNNNPIIPWGKEWPGMSSNMNVLIGDYDGDGRDDRALVDVVNGNWFMKSSAGNASDYMWSLHTNELLYGWNWSEMNAGFKTVVGDYDGDGVSDRAIYDFNKGKWYILASQTDKPFLSRSGSKFSFSYWGFGMNGQNSSSKVMPGDYDGDGITDIAYVSPSNGNLVYRSSRKGSNVTDVVLASVVKSIKKPQFVFGDFDGDYKSDWAVVDLETRKFYFSFSRTKSKKIDISIPYLALTADRSYLAKPGAHIEFPKKEGEVRSLPVPNSNIDISNLGRDVTISGIDAECDIKIIDVLGKVVYQSKSFGHPVNVSLPNSGQFIVRAGNKNQMIFVK